MTTKSFKSNVINNLIKKEHGRLLEKAARESEMKSLEKKRPQIFMKAMQLVLTRNAMLHSLIREMTGSNYYRFGGKEAKDYIEYKVKNFMDQIIKVNIWNKTFYYNEMEYSERKTDIKEIMKASDLIEKGGYYDLDYIRREKDDFDVKMMNYASDTRLKRKTMNSLSDEQIRVLGLEP